MSAPPSDGGKSESTPLSDPGTGGGRAGTTQAGQVEDIGSEEDMIIEEPPASGSGSARGGQAPASATAEAEKAEEEEDPFAGLMRFAESNDEDEVVMVSPPPQSSSGAVSGKQKGKAVANKGIPSTSTSPAARKAPTRKQVVVSPPVKQTPFDEWEAAEEARRLALAAPAISGSADGSASPSPSRNAPALPPPYPTGTSSSSAFAVSPLLGTAPATAATTLQYGTPASSKTLAPAPLAGSSSAKRFRPDDDNPPPPRSVQELEAENSRLIAMVAKAEAALERERLKTFSLQTKVGEVTADKTELEDENRRLHTANDDLSAQIRAETKRARDALEKYDVLSGYAKSAAQQSEETFASAAGEWGKVRLAEKTAAATLGGAIAERFEKGEEWRENVDLGVRRAVARRIAEHFMGYRREWGEAAQKLESKLNIAVAQAKVETDKAKRW